MANTDSVTFVAVSGINFPYMSRKYLIDLVAEVVKRHDAKFVLVAGNAIAGKFLERELRSQIQREREEIRADNLVRPRGQKKALGPDDKEEVEQIIIEETAQALNDFLPRLGVNYHFVLAPRVYDGRLGVAVIRRLRELREDVRLIENPETGLPEEEAKIPIEISHFPDMRVLVPRRQPWFYKNLSGLGQRLLDAFVPRTFSSSPSLMLVGCTGTAIFIPRYRGVPTIMLPTLHKIDEQLSSESAVGCAVVTVAREKNGIHPSVKFYNFRPAIASAREQVIINTAETPEEREALEALRASSASRGTILRRINQNRKKGDYLVDERVEELLQNLAKRKLISFSKASNRWNVSPHLLRQANVSLDDILKESVELKHTVLSCIHIGALKTLYFTLLRYVPIRAKNSSALVVTGDLIQGLAHNFEYSGELEPGFGGAYDKQELGAAHIVACMIKSILELRLDCRVKENRTASRALDVLDECLIRLVVKLGNHDLWEYYTKHSLPLSLFMERLQKLLVVAITESWAIRKLELPPLTEIEALVQKKISFVGETETVEIDGVQIGLKHPHKARTLSKSQRIQEAVAYFREQGKDASVVYVANFHEAAAALVTTFGVTNLGVMTGAFVKDTQFEKNKDKVVDCGFANVVVRVKGKEVVFAEIDYDSTMDPMDAKFVLGDKFTAEDVLNRSRCLVKDTNLEWRR